MAEAARAELPDGLGRVLRPYQLDGVAYLRRSAEAGLGACLADDMGLGKTLQVLAAVDSWKAQERLGEWPAMIVMPASLFQTWKNEAARFAPGLLGSLAAFRRATDGGDRIATVRRLTRPFILRRLKTDRRIIADRAHLWLYKWLTNQNLHIPARSAWWGEASPPSCSCRFSRTPAPFHIGSPGTARPTRRLAIQSGGNKSRGGRVEGVQSGDAPPGPNSLTLAFPCHGRTGKIA